jgi:siroheme synthase-like protein
MHPYPVFLDLTGRKVLVVGDGPLAEGKLAALQECGAEVVRTSSFQPARLEGVWLVICASNDEGLNRRVSEAAAARRIFCNIVDRTALCSFLAPAIICRGELQVAVSTGGRSPALAVRVKEEIAALLGPEYGELLDLIAERRPRVFAAESDPARRAAIFQAMVRGPALELLRAGRRDAAVSVLDSPLLR